MRLSMWQQYSANHSSDFTLVGEFKTPEEAQKAGEKLHNLVKSIEAWHREHNPEYKYDKISPLEAELTNKEGITVFQSTEWLMGSPIGYYRLNGEWLSSDFTVGHIAAKAVGQYVTLFTLYRSLEDYATYGNKGFFEQHVLKTLGAKQMNYFRHIMCCKSVSKQKIFGRHEIQIRSKCGNSSMIKNTSDTC